MANLDNTLDTIIGTVENTFIPVSEPDSISGVIQTIFYAPTITGILDSTPVTELVEVEDIKCLGKFWYAYFDGLPIYVVECLSKSPSTTTTPIRCTGSCLWTFNVLTHRYQEPCQSCSPGCKCLAPTICPTDPYDIECFQVRTECIRTEEDPELLYCTTTTTSTTTSTTTTTTLACSAGCLWKNIPRIGITKLSDGCSSTCPCSAPTSLSECIETTTQCIPSPPPPLPTCSGRCQFIWTGIEWLNIQNSCSSESGCGCQPSSIDGTECGQIYDVPCHFNDEQPTTTLDNVPICPGHCLLNWNPDTEIWDVVSGTCQTPCICGYPIYDGQSECEWAEVPCVPSTTPKVCTGTCIWSYDPELQTFTQTSTSCSTGCKCLAPTSCPTNLEECFEIKTLCIRTLSEMQPIYCGTSTTTTTTTTTPSCGGECRYIVVGGTCDGVGTLRLISNTCFGASGCGCPPDGGDAESNCEEIVTGCIYSDPNFDPVVICEGGCTWRWGITSNGSGWELCSNTCQQRALYGDIPEYYGFKACDCMPPSRDGGYCNEELSTPCYNFIDPPEPTTTTPKECLGQCTLRWDLDSSSWFYVTSNCLPSCTCDQPPYDGTEDCEYVYVNCGNTTTSSTSSTTTTTQHVNCYYCDAAPYFSNFCSTGSGGDFPLPSQCSDAIIVSGPYISIPVCELECGTTTTTTSSTTTTTTTTIGWFCVTTTGCIPTCGPCPSPGTTFCVNGAWAGFDGGEFSCGGGFSYTFTPDTGPYPTLVDCEVSCSTTSTTTTTTPVEYSCFYCVDTESRSFACAPTTATYIVGCPDPTIRFGPYPTYSDCLDECTNYYECVADVCEWVDAITPDKDACPPECTSTTTTTTTETSSTTTTTTTTPHYYCITVTNSEGGPCPTLGTTACIDGNVAGFGSGTLSCGGGFTYDFVINSGPFSSIECETECSATTTTTTTTLSELQYCWECDNLLRFCGTETNAIGNCGVDMYTQLPGGPYEDCVGVIC